MRRRTPKLNRKTKTPPPPGPCPALAENAECRLAAKFAAFPVGANGGAVDIEVSAIVLITDKVGAGRDLPAAHAAAAPFPAGHMVADGCAEEPADECAFEVIGRQRCACSDAHRALPRDGSEVSNDGQTRPCQDPRRSCFRLASRGHPSCASPAKVGQGQCQASALAAVRSRMRRGKAALSGEHPSATAILQRPATMGEMVPQAGGRQRPRMRRRDPAGINQLRGERGVLRGSQSGMRRFASQ